MSTASIQLPFLQREGFARAARCIRQYLKNRHEVAIMIVAVRDVERVCAAAGHAAAASMLDDLERRLRAIARSDDSVVRLTDRKFVVMLKGLQNRGHVGLAARKIARIARETGSDHAATFDLGATIGVVLCPEQRGDASELMRFAEIAALDGLRRQESPCYYEPHTASRMFTDWGMDARLQQALEAGDLQLFFQPKSCLQSGRIAGAEGLMRWHDPEIGAISPEIFIDLAEKTGKIRQLTDFAIQSACRYVSEWQKHDAAMNVAVNVSASVIHNRDLLEVLDSATGIWGITPASLTLEVTENALMDNRDASHDILTHVRHFGCRVSIDDFGTGYSSLAYLKNLPADELKIDRSFVMRLLEDDDDRTIVAHCISLAKSFGLSVVAEGVESEETLDKLRELGCDYAQGYYLGKPMPPDDFETLIRRRDQARRPAAEKRGSG